MLSAFTARISTPDPDAFDVTRKSARGDGLAFAPSWAILSPVIDARACADELLKRSRTSDKSKRHNDAEDRRHRASAEMDDAWAVYVPAFLAEMRSSYAANRPAWERLLARERVTLVCFCTDAERCHRTILARDVLPKLGARFGGEIVAQVQMFGGSR